MPAKRLGMYHVYGSTLEMIMQTMDPGLVHRSKDNDCQPIKLTGQLPIVPTAPGPLADDLRTVSIRLLGAFVRVEGTVLSQIIRRGIEARDWLNNLEPRSVRSVFKRVLEFLNRLDLQVSPIFSFFPLNLMLVLFYTFF
ncbi:unnamed protein product [Protopolystoma xenopodis]|uniref:Uncharacterized protein n=1 Tax=Protopolystoma xenopodis TaxID=117903 RepID=A0A3S5ABZ3_9PLAT|nr:unnamed protein product [Protopolystoma xenopodis]